MYSEEIIKEHERKCNETIKSITSGPWSTEPHRVEFKHKGLNCLAVRNERFGAWCGYVGVPPGHPAYGKSYSGLEVDAHGGLTYGEGCRGTICHKSEGESDNLYWLGFDCMHFEDLYPAELKYRELPGWPQLSMPDYKTYKDVEFVKREIVCLAEQLAEMSRA